MSAYLNSLQFAQPALPSNFNVGALKRNSQSSVILSGAWAR